MSITSEFNPEVNGWYFENWGEASEFSWDLFRRTYLAINPTHDCVEAPLDCAFYEIFKSCAANGNCGGMSMLGLALYKYGGYMGFCSPASFYTGDIIGTPSGYSGPDRADLHAAINIMQARQFSAPGIQNFLDVVKAGELNDGEAAFDKIKSGLASGDYAMLSISNGLFGDAAHTVIPYAVDEHPAGFPAGTKLLHIWDSDRPFNAFRAYYIDGHNIMIIRGATDWTYDQNAGTLYSDGRVYDGSNNGWCFAIPFSLELHKARQPISVGFVLTGLTTLFVSGVGAAVTQIEDDAGRRFYTSDSLHLLRNEIETGSARRLEGVARWPWYAASKNGELPGELFFFQRPSGSPPLTVTVSGTQYHLQQAQSGHLIEIQAQSKAVARDKIHVEDFTGDSQAVELHTDGEKRHFHIHQLRADNIDGDWRSIHVRDALVSKADLRVQTLGGLDAVEVSSLQEKKEFSLEFRRYYSNTLSQHSAGPHKVAAGKAVHLTPGDWNTLEHTVVKSRTRKR